jgi:hypothetical protein
MANTHAADRAPSADAPPPLAAPRERPRPQTRCDTPEPRTRFVDAADREDACRALASQGALVVPTVVDARAQGNLASVIDESIERVLEARGASPRGFGPEGDAGEALSDRIFRARRIGATGIAVVMGPLGAAVSALGAITPEDAATLRFWAAASEDRPVWLLLDASDEATGAYADPAPLAAVLGRHAAPAPARPDARTAEELPLPDAAPVVQALDTTPEMPQIARIADAPPEPPPPAREPAPPAPKAATNDEWRAWTQALTVARGPQSLAAFERLFAHDYMPLANMIAAGLDDPRALQAREEFRRTFARSYTEAAPAFAVTGKRPRMILDAPDVAARIARLHGARSTQILLVDAMRFDIGADIRDRCSAALTARASLTDDLILWSALPTTTLRQLETLQRGPEALRIPPVEGERELDPLRGRTAEVIRRIKVGSRDFYKLDVIESRVRDLGDRALPALAEIAEVAAEAIIRHAQTLQPRTLLFVFGDHGFTFDRDGTARQGGASPEEVLVPAFALLVGDVH